MTTWLISLVKGKTKGVSNAHGCLSCVAVFADESFFQVMAKSRWGGTVKIPKKSQVLQNCKWKPRISCSDYTPLTPASVSIQSLTLRDRLHRPCLHVIFQYIGDELEVFWTTPDSQAETVTFMVSHLRRRFIPMLLGRYSYRPVL